MPPLPYRAAGVSTRQQGYLVKCQGLTYIVYDILEILETHEVDIRTLGRTPRDTVRVLQTVIRQPTDAFCRDGEE